MLSRNSSDAARLRRSKSSSTVQPSPRNPYPVPDHVNPWVAQQQALLAATAAFERAQIGVSPTKLARPPIPRMQSNTSRKSEGSHLARRGSSRLSSDDGVKKGRARRNTLQHPLSRDPVSFTSYAQSRTIPSSTPASRASPVPPSLRGKLSLYSITSPARSMASETPRAGLRKTRSMFCNSTQRYSMQNDPFSMTLVDSLPAIGTPDELTALPAYPMTSTPVIPAAKVSDVRDQYFLDFHRGVRRSRSSLLAPLKKLQSIGSRKASYSESQDVSLLSVNLPNVPSLAQPISVAPVSTVPSKFEKNRSRSGGFRAKIKKVFGRTPSTTVIVPAQQVDASREYFTPVPDNQNSTAVLDGRVSKASSKASRPGTPPLPGAAPGARQASGGSQMSQKSATSASKSRVTSWTDSSAGDTVVSKETKKRLSIIHENSRPNIAMPVPTRPASVLTRIFDDTEIEIPKPQRSRFSVEPKRVFSALMREIARKDLEVMDVTRVEVDANGNVSSSILDTLPSQQRLNSIGTELANAERLDRMTIRAVTPDPMGSIRGQVRIPAMDLPDVTEESSDDGFVLPAPDAMSMCAPSQRTSTSSSGLRRYRAQTPSAEQLAARADRASQRWKTSLDDARSATEKQAVSELPNKDQETPFAIPERNPRRYNGAAQKLTTSQAYVQPSAPGTEFVDAPATPHGCVTPSIYSRHTTTPVSADVTPLANGQGTAVIITSRPVSSHPVGAPRNLSNSIKSSRDWRAWLSKEVAELAQLADPDITIYDKWNIPTTNSLMNIEGEGSNSGSSSDGGSMRRLIRGTGGQLSNSGMNERFPLMSARSTSSHSTASATRPERGVSPEVLTEQWRNHSRESLGMYTSTPKVHPSPSICVRPSLKSAITAPPLSHSALNLAQFAPPERYGTPPRAPSPAQGSLRSPLKILKAKSALELHNRFSVSGSPSYEHHRKIVKSQAVQDLEGETLLRISAGPYAEAGARTPFSCASESPVKGVENSPVLSKFGEVGLSEGLSRRGSVVASTRASTPGQRMVDVFLSERESRGRSPVARSGSAAFI